MARDDVETASVINFPVGDRRVQFVVPTQPDLMGGNIFYEPEVVNVIGKVVRGGDLVIDAGANYGFFTLILSQLVGPTGLVMSFEPDPAAYAELIQNVGANEFGNIICSDVALWDKDGEKEFWVYPQSGYSSFGRYETASSKVVQTRKLDTLLQSFRPPSFMKLDCEGSEPWILHGAEATLLRGVQCVVAELNYELLDDFKMSRMMLREYMASIGYHMFLISIKEPGSNEYKLVRVEPDQALTIKCSADRARVINVMFSRSLDPLACSERSL